MVAKSEYIVYIENLSSSTRSSDVKCVPNPPEAAEMSLRLRIQSLPSRSIEVMCDSCVGRSVCDMATSMRWKGTTLRNQRLWSSGGEHLHLSLECCMELHFHIQCGMNEPAAWGYTSTLEDMCVPYEFAVCATQAHSPGPRDGPVPDSASARHERDVQLHAACLNRPASLSMHETMTSSGIIVSPLEWLASRVAGLISSTAFV